MGDEVTKKDLQALQSNVNKQIAELARQIPDPKAFQGATASLSRQVTELDKRLSEVKRELLKDGEDNNSVIVRVRQDAFKRMDELQTSINTLARAVADVAKKVGM
jgi:hypothetical protein